MQKRSKKRIIITISYFLLITGVFWFFILLIRSNPTCSDGRRNQGEEDIDCGGPCSPCVDRIVLEGIEIGQYEWVHYVGNKYDFIATIKNPNNNYGASHIKYRMKIKTQKGEVFVQPRWIESFVLPREEKTVLVQGIELESSPLDIEIELDTQGINWEKFTDFEEPEFIINDKRYTELGGGSLNFSNVWAMVINKSSTDFEEVNIKAILRNSEGRLIATNSQVVGAFKAGEIREALMNFQQRFEGEVKEIHIEVETDPFDPQNIMKARGQIDPWDEIR